MNAQHLLCLIYRATLYRKVFRLFLPPTSIHGGRHYSRSSRDYCNSTRLTLRRRRPPPLEEPLNFTRSITLPNRKSFPLFLLAGPRSNSPNKLTTAPLMQMQFLHLQRRDVPKSQSRNFNDKQPSIYVHAQFPTTITPARPLLLPSAAPPPPPPLCRSPVCARVQ